MCCAAQVAREEMARLGEQAVLDAAALPRHTVSMDEDGEEEVEEVGEEVLERQTEAIFEVRARGHTMTLP